MFRFLLFGIILTLISSCGDSDQNLMQISLSNSQIEIENGIVYFKKDPFSGQLIDSFPKGGLKLEQPYMNGRKEGLETRWYPNQQIMSLRRYQKGTKVGKHQAWWQNGNNKFSYQFNELGYYNGPNLEWFETGQLAKSFNYVDGQEAGSQKLFLVDGSIKANYQVVNGERFGLIGLKRCYTVSVEEGKLR